MAENKTGSPVKVLVVDDQRLVRDGIASILSLFGDIEVCGTAADGVEAVSLAASLKPDVILMDIRMPKMDGITAAVSIIEKGTAPAIIMLTTFDDEEYIVKALQAGASGYLLKDLPPEELHEAILTVNRGGFQSTTALMGKIIGRTGAGGGTKQNSPSQQDELLLETFQALTNREQNVLALIGQGATNHEIAVELGLSEGTVKNYITSLLDTMGFRDRIQAAIFAVRNSITL